MPKELLVRKTSTSTKDTICSELKVMFETFTLKTH